MAIVRWEPFRDFSQLQDRINRAFADAVGRADEGLMTSGSWVPPVDIYQSSEHELVLKAELPDMSHRDIEITVDNGTLTIRGEKKAAADVKEEQFHRIERRYGAFARSFSLPPTIDSSKMTAEYKNGLLTVRLPLREESKPRQIRVDVVG
jgi:HSP20 family protein